MGRFRCCNGIASAALCLAVIPLLACTQGYTGSVDLHAHPWLKGRRIFIDPGHGGRGPCPLHRTGPHGICEDRVNLNIALILADMLKTAGAAVKLSRTGNGSVSSPERAAMAREFNPDILISIHGASSLSPDERPNFARVLIWGGPAIQPAAHDLAVIVADEMQKLLGAPAVVASDLSLYGEGGVFLLREARSLCPAVLCEAGFFTHPVHAGMVRDPLTLERFAEAFFHAVSRYCRRGIPKASAYFSCKIENGRYLNLIRDPKPAIFIVPDGKSDASCIDERTLRISIDGIPAGWKKTPEGRIAIDYGEVLYPGFHRIRFQYKNLRGQNSMICTIPFTLAVNPGDYCRLISEGRRRLYAPRDVRKGLRMLLAALSIEPLGPDSRAITNEIARGFAAIGDYASSEYYRRLSLGQSISLPCEINDAVDSSSCISRRMRAPMYLDHYLMIDYHGKDVPVFGKRCDERSDDGKNKIEIIERIKQFFSRQL